MRYLQSMSNIYEMGIIIPKPVKHPPHKFYVGEITSLLAKGRICSFPLCLCRFSLGGLKHSILSYLWLTSAESYYIFRCCMMYKWSIIFHMQILCSIEIYIRMSTSSVSQYHVRIGCDQYKPQDYRVFKALPKSAKGREGKMESLSCMHFL